MDAFLAFHNIPVARSGFIRAHQLGGRNTVLQAFFTLDLHLFALVDALVADDPAYRATLLADGILQQVQALQQELI